MKNDAALIFGLSGMLFVTIGGALVGGWGGALLALGGALLVNWHGNRK